MRIIYLHQYFNSPAMAGGTRSYEMARRLVSAGHEVDLVTTWREPTAKNDWFETDEGGIRVHWLPVEYSNCMNYAQRILAFAYLPRSLPRLFCVRRLPKPYDPIELPQAGCALDERVVVAIAQP